MTSSDYANAGAVTRAVKQLINAPAVRVTTRHCIRDSHDGYGWHTIVFLERGEQRNAAVAALEAAGWTVKNPGDYDSFFGAFVDIQERKADAARGEAFLRSTFASTPDPF